MRSYILMSAPKTRGHAVPLTQVVKVDFPTRYPCVWLKKSKDGTGYEHVAIFVDDLNTLKDKYKLKIKGDGPLEYPLDVITILTLMEP